MLAVPLIALVLGVDDAVVLVALPNLGANVYLCWESRDARSQTRDLGVLVGFGVVGAVIGTVALVRLPEEPLLILLAFMIGAFVFQFLRRARLRHRPSGGPPVVAGGRDGRRGSCREQSVCRARWSRHGSTASDFPPGRTCTRSRSSSGSPA